MGRFCRVCRPRHTVGWAAIGGWGWFFVGMGEKFRVVGADILIGPDEDVREGQSPSPTVAFGREHVGDGLQDVPMWAGNTRPYRFIRKKA